MLPTLGEPLAIQQPFYRTPDFMIPGSLAYPLRLEDSPRGLGRTLGKRVGGNPSRVRISYPPPLPRVKKPQVEPVSAARGGRHKPGRLPSLGAAPESFHLSWARS